MKKPDAFEQRILDTLLVEPRARIANPWLCDCGMGRDSLVHLQGCARSSFEAARAIDATGEMTQ